MAQPALSFMKLVTKTGTLPKSSRAKLIDPLTLAKNKVLDALKAQKEYVALVLAGKSLPKKGEGTKAREVSIWFSKHSDGWWTNIRYGQLPIPIDGDKSDMRIGELKDVPAFYDAVSTAVRSGELDAQITAIQAKRSEKAA